MFPRPNARKTVLVVEDDALTREALVLALEADGHRAGRAANGQEALDLLRQGPPPDLIVLDLTMPVLDGWQFRRQQRADAALSAIPVVVLSAHSDLPRGAGPLGAAAHLQKPLEIGRLLDAVRPFLAAPRAGEHAIPAPESPAPLALVLRSTAEVAPLLDAVAGAMTGKGFARKDVFGMRLSLEEALVNAIKHGHRGDPAKQVRVRYQVTAEQAFVEVEDEGPGFDRDLVPDALSAEGLERASGRGLLLMRHFMTWVRYNARGNAVALCKQRSVALAHAEGT